MEWMVWTTPTTIFFSAIAAMLTGMTAWEVISPTIERKASCRFRPLVVTASSSDCSQPPIFTWRWWGSPRSASGWHWAHRCSGY